MYRGTIRHGAHKCLVNEKQEALLRPWKGMSLYHEKCKVRGEYREGRGWRKLGKDTLSLSTMKETEEAKLSCSTATVCVWLCVCACVSSCTH